MFYKKGQIVPRSIIRCKHRKTQHLWTFGADVEIIRKRIWMFSEGSALIRMRSFVGGHKGKPKIIDNADMNGFSIYANSKSTGITIIGEEHV